MEGKFIFWIISDDLNIAYLQRSLNRPKFGPAVIKHVNEHLEYKLIGKSLREVVDIQGSPDVFIVDVGCLSNYNTNDRHYELFKQFVKKHTSALFCIVSLVPNHMHNLYDELSAYVQDEVVCEMWGNGNEALAEYMVKKVLQYYPLKG